MHQELACEGILPIVVSNDHATGCVLNSVFRKRGMGITSGDSRRNGLAWSPTAVQHARTRPHSCIVLLALQCSAQPRGRVTIVSMIQAAVGLPWWTRFPFSLCKRAG